ncbi:MAG TPA: hypothetical protein VMX97_13285, partial [Hyphomicrobiaceae bacterium]|nr:hypothetical protein [Hyphomicrobiaceae bacterium]
WFAIASQAGDKSASGRQAQIARQMKAADIAAADSAVSEWRQVPPSKIANDPRYAGELWKQRANK